MHWIIYTRSRVHWRPWHPTCPDIQNHTYPSLYSLACTQPLNNLGHAATHTPTPQNTYDPSHSQAQLQSPTDPVSSQLRVANHPSKLLSATSLHQMPLHTPSHTQRITHTQKHNSPTAREVQSVPRPSQWHTQTLTSQDTKGNTSIL